MSTELYGLQNINNSCFINASLQLLMRIEKLKNFFIENTLESNKLNEIKSMYNTYINKQTNNFLKIRAIIFKNIYEQQDAQEFLIQIFQYINKGLIDEYNKLKINYTNIEISKIKLKNFLNNLINIEIITMKICKNCNKDKEVYKNEEPMISLDVEGTLINGIENFLREVYKEDIICEYCNGNKIYYYYNITKIAEYLLIHIKNKKNAIDIPQKLIINKKIYILKCYILRIGLNIENGHFIAIVNIKDKQYICNDNIIYENRNDNIINNGYIYLYEYIEN